MILPSGSKSSISTGFWNPAAKAADFAARFAPSLLQHQISSYKAIAKLATWGCTGCLMTANTEKLLLGTIQDSVAHKPHDLVGVCQ